MDGPVKPGHDNQLLDGRAIFFTRSFAGTTPKRSSILAVDIISEWTLGLPRRRICALTWPRRGHLLP